MLEQFPFEKSVMMKGGTREIHTIRAPHTAPHPRQHTEHKVHWPNVYDMDGIRTQGESQVKKPGAVAGLRFHIASLSGISSLLSMSQ